MISWQQFGLKGNPYDTLPLIEGGEFPIQQAFIGRNENGWLLCDENQPARFERRRDLEPIHDTSKIGGRI